MTSSYLPPKAEKPTPKTIFGIKYLSSEDGLTISYQQQRTTLFNLEANWDTEDQSIRDTLQGLILELKLDVLKHLERQIFQTFPSIYTPLSGYRDREGFEFLEHLFSGGPLLEDPAPCNAGTATHLVKFLDFVANFVFKPAEHKMLRAQRGYKEAVRAGYIPAPFEDPCIVGTDLHVELSTTLSCFTQGITALMLHKDKVYVVLEDYGSSSETSVALIEVKLKGKNGETHKELVAKLGADIEFLVEELNVASDSVHYSNTPATVVFPNFMSVELYPSKKWRPSDELRGLLSSLHKQGLANILRETNV